MKCVCKGCDHRFDSNDPSRLYQDSNGAECADNICPHCGWDSMSNFIPEREVEKLLDEKKEGKS